MRHVVLGWTLIASLLAQAQAAESGAPILNEGCYWRRYYRFGKSRYSPAVLKAQGESVLKRGLFERLKRETLRSLQADGLDPRKVDWRDHAYCAMRGARAFNPFPTPLPPDDWMAADFDDSAWVRQRRPFQGGRSAKITTINLGQYDESVDLRLQAGCYRARFLVDEPRAGAYSLRVVYSGGARAFLNGHELARGHLPDGALAPDTPGEDYPAEAYAKDGARLALRTLGPVILPLVKPTAALITNHIFFWWIVVNVVWFTALFTDPSSA